MEKTEYCVFLGRTRRRWLPNVQSKRLYSEILDRLVSLKVTTHAMRCIDKAGGARPDNCSLYFSVFASALL